MRVTSIEWRHPLTGFWDLASDITRVGEVSPETFEAEWPGGASGPGVGARFRGHVRRNGRGPVYWTVCTVVACDPGREFAFAVAGPGGMTVNTLALPAGTQRGVPMSPSRLSWPTRRSCACTEWSPGLRAAAPTWTACGSAGKDQGSHRIRQSFSVGPTPKLPGCRCATCPQDAVHGRAPGGIRVRAGGSWPCQL